jgi:hypothetical protein
MECLENLNLYIESPFLKPAGKNFSVLSVEITKHIWARIKDGVDELGRSNSNLPRAVIVIHSTHVIIFKFITPSIIFLFYLLFIFIEVVRIKLKKRY